MTQISFTKTIKLKKWKKTSYPLDIKDSKTLQVECYQWWFKQSSTNCEYFTEEIPTIFRRKFYQRKFQNADYPPRFVNSVIRQFSENCNGNTQDDYIVPLDFFDIRELLILVEIPYCPWNETLLTCFIKKFHEITDNSYKIRIKWISKKQLFKLKSRNPHPVCVIYKRVCVWEQTSIGKTRRNVGLRWEEHENISKVCEPAKHLKEKT